MQSPPTTSHPCKVRRGARRTRHAAGRASSIGRPPIGSRTAALAVLLLGVLLGTVAMARSRTPAAAAPDGPRETVLRGEVVDVGCFVIGGRRGEKHLHCALSCAKAGESLGIVDEQTKLLFVVVPDLTSAAETSPLLAHVAQRVEVRGVTVERGGINGIMIRKVHALAPPAKR